MRSNSIISRRSHHLLGRRVGAAAQQTGLLKPTAARLGQADATNPNINPDFIEFPEIDIANLQRVQALRAVAGRDEWVAQEKIHGSQFSIYLFNGETFRFAKRRGFLPAEGDGQREYFFGYQCLVPEMKKHMKELHRLVQEYVAEKKKSSASSSTTATAAAATTPSGELPHLRLVICDGELFGAAYGHPDFEQDTATAATTSWKPEQRHKRRGAVVPKGGGKVMPPQPERFPHYSPDIHHIAFDIKYQLSEAEPLTQMPLDDALKIFQKVEEKFLDPRGHHHGPSSFLYAKPLVRGSLDKVVAFDVEHATSTLPILLGLGDFYRRKNKMEGVILRNVRKHGVGLPGSHGHKTIMKYKSSFFQELKRDRTSSKPVQDPMADARHMAVQRVGPQIADPAAVFPDPQEVESLKLLLDHVSEGRLGSVVSKYGPGDLLSGTVTQQSLGYKLAADALKDFLKNAADADTVCAPLLVRREFARYALFEAKRLVAQQWPKLIEDAEKNAGDGESS